jgi:hypothetical protein
MRPLLLLSFALLTSCVIRTGPATESTVRKRASYDLQCNERNIAIQNIGGTSYAADGCGAHAVYNCTSNGNTCVRE